MIENELKKLNQKALKNDDVPVSCIIKRNNKIIAKAYNKKNKCNNPLFHAEIIAIIKAAKKNKTFNLNDCELYVTLEPCKMCKELIKEARIKKVFYIISQKKESVDTTKYIKYNTKCDRYFSEQLKNYFKNKR